MKIGLASGMRLGLAAALLVALPDAVCGVTCPNGGAVLNVVVYNPTGNIISTGVTISGLTSFGNGVTCTSGSSTYSRSVVVDSNNANNTFQFTGLDTGVWTHKITVSVGSNQYIQYEKTTVLEATGLSGNPYSTAHWTYFPQSVKVITTGDGYGGTCGTNCTLRQALNTANAWSTSSANPGLVVFSVSPGTMTQSSALNLTKSYITIDGTDSSGMPWVVGEAQGTQDSFSTVVDLANTTQFSLSGSYDTIMGLAILNTTSGTPSRSLIVGYGGSNTIRNVRLDGGAASLTSDCGPYRNLLDDLEYGLTVSNVEGRSACGNGIWIPYASVPPTVTKSWFHHNLTADLDVGPGASFSRNFVELAGIRASDNGTVNAYADGVYGEGASSIVTSRNVVRDNTGYGMELSAVANQSPALSLSHDYVCGNGSDGVNIYLGVNGVATGTGLGVAYNYDYGMNINNPYQGTPSLTFDNNSAFTANFYTGFLNSTGWTASAKNNQWRGVTGSPLPSCTTSSDVSGPVTCNPAQDYRAVSLGITGTNPVVPSDVINAAQTIQVQGTGFNAIDGNPLAGTTCSTGYGTDSSNCCRNTSKANACDSSTPPKGTTDHSNCVALLDRAATWQRLNASSVTPTTITTQIPSTFACIGNDGEQVRVSKLATNGSEIYGVGTYCANTDPK